MCVKGKKLIAFKEMKAIKKLGFFPLDCLPNLEANAILHPFPFS
jgi:hypothetical protein